MIRLLVCLTVFAITSFFINSLITRLSKFLTKQKKQKIIPSLSAVLSEFIKNPDSKKFNLTRMIFGLVVLAIALILTEAILLSVPFGIIGFILPGLICKHIRKRGLERFNNQLIDALNIIANSLRAGTSFTQALGIIAEESKKPLSEEFTRTTHEIKLGVPVTQALTNLAERVGSSDLNIFITTVNIARETGGSLPEILNIIANTMRERTKVQGKINSLTAQGKLSGYVVGSMPFILIAIFYLMSPEMIEPMFTTLLGQFMLAVVAILVLTGSLLIKKIVTIDI
jgi:tight adherence protein B